MTDKDTHAQEMEKAADAALEKQVFETGSGFLERPYNRYRFHNGFISGAQWQLERTRGDKEAIRKEMLGEVIEELRSQEAAIYDIESERLMFPEDWADWLEKEFK